MTDRSLTSVRVTTIKGLGFWQVGKLWRLRMYWGARPTGEGRGCHGWRESIGSAVFEEKMRRARIGEDETVIRYEQFIG